MKRNDSINFIKGYVNKVHVTLLALYSILSASLLLGIAYVTKCIIDSFVEHNTDGIAIFVSVAVVLLLLYALTYYLTNYFTSKYSMIATKSIVISSHDHLLRSVYKSTAKSHSIENLRLITSDSEIAVSTYVKLFPALSSMVVKLVLGVVIMFVISYQITLIAIGMGVLVCLFMLIFKKPIKNLHKFAQSKIALSNAYMQESAKNSEVIKALDVQGFVNTGVATRLEDVRLALTKKARLHAEISTIAYVLLETTFLVVLILGGGAVIGGKFDLANFVLLIAVVEIVKSPFMSITNIATNIFSMLASTERVRTIHNLEQDKYIDKSINTIRFDNVSMVLDNKLVLDNVSFEINAGDKVALTGYSGAGKTTIIRLIIGLIKPTLGSVNYIHNSVNINDNGLLKVGYAPQNMQILADSIRNNVVAGRDISDDRLIEVLKFVDIYDDVMNKQGGLDYVLKESGNSLSQGQIARLNIARALLDDGDIIILDEPFAALDRNIAIDIFDKLLTLDKTVIIASHDDFVREKIDKQIALGDKRID